MTPAAQALADQVAVEHAALARAEASAWSALGRHDYHGFAKATAEWAAVAGIAGHTGPSPFRSLVQMARAQSEINQRKGEKRD